MLYNNLCISTWRTTLIRILFILMCKFNLRDKNTYERDADNAHIQESTHFKYKETVSLCIAKFINVSLY